MEAPQSPGPKSGLLGSPDNGRRGYVAQIPSTGKRTSLRNSTSPQPSALGRSIGPPPRPLEVALEVGSGSRVWWVMSLLSAHYSALKDVTTMCGREDSNLQPVSRPDPKFRAGCLRLSGYVRPDARWCCSEDGWSDSPSASGAVR